MVKKFYVVLVLIAIILAILFYYFNTKKNDFETCNTRCIKKGYPGGSCKRWYGSESPESQCSAPNLNYIPGYYSDCSKMYEKLNVPDGIAGAGGFICCCR